MMEELLESKQNFFAKKNKKISTSPYQPGVRGNFVTPWRNNNAGF